MRADRFALGLVALGLCAAGPLSCGEPFKMGASSSTSMGGSDGGGSSTSSGGPVSCTSDKDCPKPDVGCSPLTCEQGICSNKTMPQSTSQVYGDCKVTKCSQEGKRYDDNDDNDVYDDANPCTDDKCEKGVLVASPRLGMACMGTMVCNADKQCVECVEAKNCADGRTCTRGKCVLDSCSNGKPDAKETDSDCGGIDCNPCEDGKVCIGDLDCANNNCVKDKDGKKTCVSTCIDNKQDGEETGTDCGGEACVKLGQACADGYGCKLPRDCMSGVCKTGKCQQPSCTDGLKNGDETGIDCGGKICVSCN